MSKLFEQLTPYLEKQMAVNTALTLFNWDMETLAPADAVEYTSKVIGILSGEAFSAVVNEEVRELLSRLSSKEAQAALTDKERAIVANLKKELAQIEQIPPKEYQAYSELTAKSQSVWAQAKKHNRYEEFAPLLQEQLAYQKRFLSYREKEGLSSYDLLLNDYEEGFTTKELDAFFAQLKSAILPLLQDIAKKNGQSSAEFLTRSYPVERQKEFARFLAGYLGFDFNRGVMAESEHPFTTNLHNHDVRITNHYYENQLDSAIFSVIHEGGHALYEMGVSDDLTQTLAGTNMSMGIHESQSRFYENIIGRSPAFWEPIYGKLVSFFPEQLSDIPLEQFIRAINQSKPGLIRTEADELTYSLHIMVRYELERALFAEEITVEELPKLWNEKYREYLGITPPDDTQGVLQDVHWSSGSFGYFPSYAIGSAIAAQIYYHMLDSMPFEQYLREGNLSVIREYLRDHLHKYGTSRSTMELLKNMTGETFRPEYYIRYLTEKYTKVYQL